jgi:hypothetical protein
MKHRYTGRRKPNTGLQKTLSTVCREHSARLRFIAPDSGRVIVEVHSDNDTDKETLAYDIRFFTGPNTGITYIIV